MRTDYRSGGEFDAVSFTESMSVHYADEARSRPVRVALHVTRPFGPDGLFQEFELEEGRVEAGHLDYRRVTESLFSPDGVVEQRFTFDPSREVPIEKVDLSLGIPTTAAVADDRPGTNEAFSYRWPGHLPDLKDLEAMVKRR